MRGGAGACRKASTASTTTRSRGANSAGGRSGISPRSSRACGDTGDIRGPLAKVIGEKGYHPERFEGRPYPVDGE